MPKLNKPVRRPFRGVRDFPPTHCLGDGDGGIWTHDGWSKDCPDPRCVTLRAEQDHGPWGDWPPAVPGPGEPGDPWPPLASDEDI